MRLYICIKTSRKIDAIKSVSLKYHESHMADIRTLVRWIKTLRQNLVTVLGRLHICCLNILRYDLHKII